MEHRPYEWDDDPIGDRDTGIRRRWRRPWNHYLAIMVGLIGFILLCGSFWAPGVHTVGAVLVLLSPWAIARSDGRRTPPATTPPPPPTLGEELAWAGVAAAMVVVGVTLFLA